MRAESVALGNIKIEDSFWSRHVNLVREAIIPYQWEAMNDRIADAESSHCMENFKIAAGISKGAFYGAVFQDTDVAKWLEAVGFSLACYPDEKLKQTADEVIDIIAGAQGEDGYLNTYFTLQEPDGRWSNLCEGHELYTAGHFMEAAVAYYEGTKERKLLDCMCRFADLICETFGNAQGKKHGYPGHQEVEIGLIKLYRTTGKKKYLEQASYFIEARGVGENYFLQEMKRPSYQRIFPEFARYDPRYSQSHLPVREQTTAEGHAVRAVYMYCAMADLAYEYQDQSLLSACERLWLNITQKRMYITGGIGSSGILERFTTDYDLPNEYNYAESCASIGLALFGLRMAQITRQASYVDVVERALYNTVLAGISLEGKSFFYVNPLEVWPQACMDRTSREHVKPVRQKWFGVACCPPNIARTLASLGQYIYGVEQSESRLYINLFVSNQTKIMLGNSQVLADIETKFPWENEINVTLRHVPVEGMYLFVRVPEYAQHYTVMENGKPVAYQIDGGYAVLEIKKDTKLTVGFEAPPKLVRANPLVRADVGKAAIVRGPLVYCLEEVDNGENLSALYLKGEEELTEEWSDKLGGIVQIMAHGERVKQDAWQGGLYGSQRLKTETVQLCAVPYPYWNNRGMGEMCVWIKEKI